MDGSRRRGLQLVSTTQNDINAKIVAVCLTIVVLILIIALFSAGMWIGPYLSGRTDPMAWLESRPVSPSMSEEIRLLGEAEAYVLFWERRQPRLEKAAARYGWSKAELKIARRLIEAARLRFEAVEIGYRGWGDPSITLELLKREVDGLIEHLGLTFCTQFGLECLRGVPPDQAHFLPARGKT